MSNSKIFSPRLLNIVDKLESKRKNIASKWIEIATVKAVFKAHKISTIKFKDGYGIPIIEYFIAVVREEKELGNCPIMSKLVSFLLEKDITPKDVFDICMGLRRTLVSHLYSEKLIEKNALEALEEVATIFDANLSGVLALFTDFYAQKQEKIQKSIVQQKRYNQVLKIINFINTKIIIVQSGHIIMGNKSFFDMLGVKNLKELYKKHEDDFASILGIGCDIDKCELEDVDSWLKTIDTTKKPFKTDIYHNARKKIFTYSGRVSSLPDSEPTKYIISLNSISSHLEDEAHMRERLEHDELTGLNNYVKFEHLLGEAQRRARKQNSNLALAIIDIPHLKEINEKQGMDGGDAVIISVADHLQAITNENIIVARLEGSRFGLLIPYESEQDSYDWCCTLHIELSRMPERKTISLTAFDLGETVNTLQMRAYSLIDMLNLSEDGTISTDFENIELYEALADQERFTQRLKDIKDIKTTLYYKGLAISANSKLVYVDKESAKIKLSTKEFSIATAGEDIYLEFPSLGVIKASIYSLDEKKMIATLYKFKLNRYTPLMRKMFRVEITETISADILSDGPLCEGSIIDMNEQCIAVKVKRKRSLAEGGFVSLEIMFDSDGTIKLFDTEATIQKIQRIKESFNVVLLCHLDSVNKTLLQNYIANRQMEIIHELKDRETVEDFSI